jgi:hypothetical protein
LILRARLGLVLSFGEEDSRDPSHKRSEAPERPITFNAAEDLGAFGLAELWADRTAWPISERTAYAELATMSALAKWLTRWPPIAIHGAMLAGAKPEAVAGALGRLLNHRGSLQRRCSAGPVDVYVAAALDPIRGLLGVEEETLAHFAVMLAAHRGQLAALDVKIKHLLPDGGGARGREPKGSPMIAWHDLDDQEAAAVRADLAKWISEVLFPLYPSARESVRECWDKHPDAVTELSACWLIFTPPSRPSPAS